MDIDTSSSEPETTGDDTTGEGEDDFLNEDFWISNKKEIPPPVPLRTDSIKSSVPTRNASSYGENRKSKDDSVQFRFSVPPLPKRPQSMHVVNHTPILSEGNQIPPEIPSRPKPPPRKVNQRKSEENGKISADRNYSFVRRPKKQDSGTEDSWVIIDKAQRRSNDLEGKDDTLKAVCDSEFAQNGEETYDDFTLKREDDIYEYASGAHSKDIVDGKVNIAELDDGYQAIAEVKEEIANKRLSDSTDFNSHLRVSLPITNEDFNSHLRVSLPLEHEKCTDESDDIATPTNKERYSYSDNDITPAVDNDYAPFPGEKPAKVQSSQSDYDNFGSIPTLPVRSASHIPDKPPRKNRPSPNTSPSHTPKKIPPLQENSKTGEKLPKTESSNYSVPPRKRNVPPLTDYAYVTRKSGEVKVIEEQPKLPPPRGGQKPDYERSQTLTQKEEDYSDYYSMPPRNSPTFDRSFQFNVGSTDARDSEDDEESHDYEDATMMHETSPPVPPPRSSRPKISKSHSVCVPSIRKKAELEITACEDDSNYYEVATGRKG